MPCKSRGGNTRDTIISQLKVAVEELFDVVMRTQDNLQGKQPPADGYEATFTWGQYANPSFEAMVETLVKAKQGQIMSTERVVEELYGNDLDDNEKAEEVALIKAEYNSTTEVMTPSIDDNELFGDETDESNTASEPTSEPKSNSGE